MRAAVLIGLLLSFFPRGASPLLEDSPVTRSDAVVTGQWGGTHIVLQATDGGGTVEYDCARGEISEPLRPDGQGRFEAKGTHSPEHGGPTRKDEQPVRRPALYTGTVKGEQMRLTVTLVDPQEDLGTFELVQGSEGHLVKCR